MNQIPVSPHECSGWRGAKIGRHHQRRRQVRDGRGIFVIFFTNFVAAKTSKKTRIEKNWRGQIFAPDQNESYVLNAERIGKKSEGAGDFV
jgi:hypothetical protein